MEHGDTINLLKEIQANQQSLHDAMSDLANRFSELEKKVSDLNDIAEQSKADPNAWLELESDPLYPHARQIVVEVGKASTSLLQRVLRIGYSRAAALIDALEENDVIGPAVGSRPRTIILTQDELDNEDEVANSNFQFDTFIPDGDDELYEAAKQAVIEAGMASTSYIQRKLRIGYSRSIRLMDMLEANGVVGPADGLKPRSVLKD